RIGISPREIITIGRVRIITSVTTLHTSGFIEGEVAVFSGVISFLPNLQFEFSLSHHHFPPVAFQLFIFFSHEILGEILCSLSRNLNYDFAEIVVFLGNLLDVIEILCCDRSTQYKNLHFSAVLHEIAENRSVEMRREPRRTNKTGINYEDGISGNSVDTVYQLRIMFLRRPELDNSELENIDETMDERNRLKKRNRQFALSDSDNYQFDLLFAS
ncbi:hypothetical protein PENTCL1PPCAC_3386, partial [Pristionchus entomophagus]